MTIITEKLESFDSYYEFLGYEPEKVLFFDIETTGLSASNSIVFLIGAIFRQDEEWILTQWLADSKEDEKQILEAFLPYVASAETIIHFNGSTFDIPYITVRAEYHHLPCDLADKSSIDLYRRFRPIQKMYGLERMNQTSLEKFLGWQREDRLTGKHMISLFQKYALSQEPSLRSLLLLHNHDDMLGMLRLLCLTPYLMLRQGYAEILDIEVSQNQVYITLEIAKSLPVPYEISHTLHTVPALQHSGHLAAPLPCRSIPCEDTVDIASCISLNICESHGILTLPLLYGEFRYFFPDYKNYYYLPQEDQAVHKSIGIYIDKENRSNARPDNCYIRKTGYFLWQPAKKISPVFQKEYGEKTFYFECTEANLSCVSFKGYVSDILHYIFNTL